MFKHFFGMPQKRLENHTHPLLTVCIITYNHAQYINQAFDSVLQQRTNFSWEILVADDFSTDGTRDIILEYKNKSKVDIKTIFQEENVGAARNWKALIFSPISKYIAYFEGDDYWTDPYKLQKQVDYLEQHPDCAICYHRVHTLQDGQLLPETLNTATTAENYTLDDLLPGNKMHTVSVVFRNMFSSGIPAWISRCPIGDYPLHCYNAQQGYIHYMPDIMAVYRLHSASYYSHLPQYRKYVKIIQTLEMMRRHLSLSTGQHKVIASRSQMYIHYLLNTLWQQKMYGNAIRLVGRYSLLYPGTCLRWAATRLRHPLAHA